jgi:hypothetical protein
MIMAELFSTPSQGRPGSQPLGKILQGKDGKEPLTSQ